MYIMKFRRTAIFAIAALCCSSALALPVIPGATGFGINTPAGRGGAVMRVTNLNDHGAGSLRACVEATGPRICVFEVSGTIKLASDMTASSPRLTIAGQTAPAPGIMLRNASLAVRASDVLIQHIAVRAGDDPDGSALHSRDSLKIIGRDPIQNIVIDHNSFSWAIDEVAEVWKNWTNVTFSNNIFSEPLRDSPPGTNPVPQGYDLLIDSTDGKISIISNLFAHADHRSPATGAADFVFVNNVVYNGGASIISLYNIDGLTSNNSVVGNMFIGGPDSVGSLPIRLVGWTKLELNNYILPGTRLFVTDNLAAGEGSDPWSIVQNMSKTARDLVESPTAPTWPDGLEAISTGDSAVLDHVLKTAGTRPANRNSVDARVIEEVRTGTGQYINCVVDDGTSRCDRNAGGWPKLAKNVRKLDVPANPQDDDDGDGYSNVEEWLQAMASTVEGKSGAMPSSASAQPSDDTAPPKPPVIVN